MITLRISLLLSYLLLAGMRLQRSAAFSVVASVKDASSSCLFKYHDHHQQHQQRQPATTRLGLSSSSSSWDDSDDEPSLGAQVESLKADLVRACQSSNDNDDQIKSLVDQLLTAAEQAGVGQASSTSGWLSGTWELMYSTDDATRSSPFFWAFRKAFPDSSDQIFGITDAIPAPIKEVGPAIQEMDWNDGVGSSGSTAGRFVSKVKVATLGGAATSIMTTRASMVRSVGLDGIELAIETTKPEKSTVLSTLLGPLGSVVNENAPAFPSGDALERAMPGSSRVVMRTPFCDESLRISWSEDRPNDLLVWKRQEFAEYDFL